MSLIPPLLDKRWQFVTTVSADKAILDVTCSDAENALMDIVPDMSSEKEVHEVLQQSSIKTNDDHLVEFSEAIRTVAKALRRVAEGKAAAQAEAAEWRRKYELEKAHNLLLEHKAITVSLTVWYQMHALPRV